MSELAVLGARVITHRVGFVCGQPMTACTDLLAESACATFSDPYDTVGGVGHRRGGIRLPARPGGEDIRRVLGISLVAE